MITAFDQATCQAVREAALAALRPAAGLLGLRVEPAGGSFEAHAFTVRFRFTVMQTAEGMSGEEAQFRSLCRLYGLTPEDSGRVFRSRGRTYRLAGFAPSRPKFCVVGQRVPDGKRFGFPRSVLARLGHPAEERDP